MEELDEGDPVALARDNASLQERLPSVRLLGGCCGTDHRHVAEIVSRLGSLAASRRDARPSAAPRRRAPPHTHHAAAGGDHSAAPKTPPRAVGADRPRGARCQPGDRLTPADSPPGRRAPRPDHASASAARCRRRISPAHSGTSTSTGSTWRPCDAEARAELEHRDDDASASERDDRASRRGRRSRQSRRAAASPTSASRREPPRDVEPVRAAACRATPKLPTAWRAMSSRSWNDWRERVAVARAALDAVRLLARGPTSRDGEATSSDHGRPAHRRAGVPRPAARARAAEQQQHRRAARPAGAARASARPSAPPRPPRARPTPTARPGSLEPQAARR